MHHQKVFWISFAITLAVLCPLFLLILTYVNAVREKPAETPQSGIWIAQATVRDEKTVLVMTGSDTAQNPDSFVLIHLGALENRISAVALPPETIVLVEGHPQTLAHAIESAGPSQGVSALAETLRVPVDNYLFSVSSALWQAAESFGSVALRPDEYLPPDVAQALFLPAYDTETPRLTPRFFAQLLANPLVPRENLQALRAAGYVEFLRVGTGLLQQTLPTFVRRSSAQIATDITATELYDYERILRFLDRQEPTCRAGQAPGTFITRTNGDTVYELSPAAAELAKDYFSRPVYAGVDAASDSMASGASATVSEDAATSISSSGSRR